MAMGARASSLRRAARTVALAAVAAAAASAWATDGRIELNHLRVLAGNVTPGDTPGYPVTLSRPGAYLLTGPLSAPAKTSAILVTAPDVRIDLNGNTISGGFACAPGACAPVSGSGIETNVDLGGSVWVENGVVRGFGSDCVQVWTGSRVARLHVFDCGEDGIEAGQGSEVRENTIQRIGRHGIFFSKNEGTYGENVISGVATAQVTGVSVFRGTAIAGNLCDDDRCSTHALRRYYLSTGIGTGATAPAVCAAGFHMASAFELRDTSQLEYFIPLGDAEADSGRGPVSNNSGWVHTGDASSTTTNCSGFTSAAAAQTGYRMILRFPTNWNDPATQLSPWQASAAVACNLATNVWCIED
jgi:hypothetical protein